MEDIDPPREVPGSARSIVANLEQLGMKSDQVILYQSQRTHAYRKAITQLLNQGQAFWCGCSRSDLPAAGIYPGTCRNGLAQGKSPRTVRFRVTGASIKFTDLIQGEIEEHLEQSVGDFVIQRADGFAAYQLAVVVDDAYQQITEVVRGADLLDSTARQICLQQALNLPTPIYAHHPIAVHGEGQKLSKRHESDPISKFPAIEVIYQALKFLGQLPPPGMELDDLWSWAIEHWQLTSIPRKVSLPAHIPVHVK